MKLKITAEQETLILEELGRLRKKEYVEARDSDDMYRMSEAIDKLDKLTEILRTGEINLNELK